MYLASHADTTSRIREARPHSTRTALSPPAAESDVPGSPPVGVIPRHGSLADVAYERMLAWIMDGTLEPGMPLRLASLATSLGISQTPLRESLARLEGQGLVIRLPMRGFSVAEPLSAEDLDRLMEARFVLEPAIAGRAAARALPSQIAELQEVLSRSAAVELGPRFDDYRAYLDFSAEFHDLIGVASGNRFLHQAVDSLPIHIQRFRLFGEEGVNDRDVAVAEHQEILDAIADHDAERATEAMRRHISGVHARSMNQA